MKKFAFNLESVLNHRKLLEETEQQELLKIQYALEKTQQEKTALLAETWACRERVSCKEAGAIDMEEVRDLARYLDKLSSDIIAVTQRISQLEEDQRRQSERLVEARKRREILDKLKDKSFAEYLKVADRVEQKLLDELATTQFQQSDKQNLPVRKPNS